MEFQRYPLKFHAKYLADTLIQKDVYIVCINEDDLRAPRFTSPYAISFPAFIAYFNDWVDNQGWGQFQNINSTTKGFNSQLRPISRVSTPNSNSGGFNSQLRQISRISTPNPTPTPEVSTLKPISTPTPEFELNPTPTSELTPSLLTI